MVRWGSGRFTGAGVKIAMFMPGLGPGALGLDVHRDFARAIETLDHQFAILTTSPGSRAVPDEVIALPEARGLRDLARALVPVLRTRALVPAAATLAAYLKRHGDAIDLLHVEVAYPTGAAVVLAAIVARWRGPIVMTPMGEDTIVVDSVRYGFRRHIVPRGLVAWTLRRATFIRSISPLLDAELATIAPATPRRVVPLNVSTQAVTAVNESRERRAERRRAARRVIDDEYGTAGKPMVLSLGRLHPFKGLDLLVRAMGSLPSARLLLVGPSLRLKRGGDTATALLRLAREIGVADRVRWVGPVPPTRSLDFLSAADVLVVPSRLESLNKVCVEAAAVGTPFVVTETTGVSAWVPADGIGLVIPANDQSAIAAAVEQLHGRSTDSDEEARRAFVQRFSPRHVAEQMAEIYREAAAGQGEGS